MAFWRKIKMLCINDLVFMIFHPPKMPKNGCIRSVEDSNSIIDYQLYIKLVV